MNRMNIFQLSVDRHLLPGPCQPVGGGGGVFQNFSGKQKFFREMLATGGGRLVDVIFSKTKVPEIFCKTNSQNFQQRNLHF